MDLKKLLLLFTFLSFSSIIFFNSTHGVEGREVSREEDLELERQLKLLNKPAIKSIKTDEGDIFDCVDIFKQPALDHPLLKNHKVQTRPSYLPSGRSSKNSSRKGKSLGVGLKDGGCPEGTVLIRRTQREDLIRAKSFSSTFWANYSHPLAMPTSLGHHIAAVATKKVENMYFGTQAEVGLWRPSVLNDQVSSAEIWITDGPGDRFNAITVGWTVNPRLYGDKNTRLFTYWTADGAFRTGCYNILCQGFVQTSRNFAPGQVLTSVSSVEGIPQNLEFLVIKDPSTKDWWFVLGPNKERVGYWPNSLFNSLSDGGNAIVWGGQVYSPPMETSNSPPMGSGHFSKEGIGRSAYFKDIQFINAQNQLLYLQPTDRLTLEDAPNCYDTFYDEVVARHHFFYGGPGHCRI